MIFLISILIALVFPIAALVVALLMRGRIARLEKQFENTRSVLASLSKTLDELKRSSAHSDDASTPESTKPEDASKIQPRLDLEEDETEDTEPPTTTHEREEESLPQPQPAIAREKHRSAADLEEMIGARWSVILGGIAVALGAIFLVNYVIEAGILGAKARIALGSLLSIALFVGGEWLRRHDKKLNLPVIEKADIPGVLTGAGATAAFATLYSAYALYGFLAPGVAFVGLTIIGLASLLLSSLHGPKLAALGVLGAYVTPLLVSTQDPKPLALAFHILVVTASVMAIARIRGWLWLAFSGIIGGSAWTALAAFISHTSTGLAGVLLLIGLTIIFVATFAWQKAEQPEPLEDRDPDSPGLLAFLALTFALVIQLVGNEYLPEIFTGLALALTMIGTAIVWPSLSLSALIGAVVVIIVALAYSLPFTDLSNQIFTNDFTLDHTAPDIPGYLRNLGILTVPTSVLAIWGGYRAAKTAPKMAGWLAVAASLIAFVVLVIVYLRIAPFETRPLFGAIALSAAFGFASLTEIFTRLRSDDLKAPAPAAFAVASVALISFAISVSLTKVWMPVGFAISSAGMAWIYSKRPIQVLPWLVVIAALLSACSLWFSIPFPGTEIGVTPFLNNLLIIVGLPAVTLIAAGEILRHNDSRLLSSCVIAIGLATLGLFVGLELRHWLTDGEIASSHFTLIDMSAQTIAALSFAIGLQQVAKNTTADIYEKASLAAGALSAVMIAGGLAVLHNPLFTNEPIGEGSLLNLLLPGYLIPGILAVVVAWRALPVRPRWYVLAYVALAGLLFFIYANASTRYGFHGSQIGLQRSTSDTEFWTYSAVWLIFGSAVLAIGLWKKSLPIRLASAVVIGLTICKVFLLDLSSLTGALRAFSFLGLGASLLLMGYFYQRILLRQGAPLETADDTA